MIILDEQLLGRGLEDEIGKWHKGSIRFITELRPNTVIKDEAIPDLLRSQNDPVFLTINEKDFWQKVKPDKKYCIVCFALSDGRVKEISPNLRVLFQMPEFKTKTKRMGNIIRVTKHETTFYSLKEEMIKKIMI